MCTTLCSVLPSCLCAICPCVKCVFRAHRLLAKGPAWHAWTGEIDQPVGGWHRLEKEVESLEAYLDSMRSVYILNADKLEYNVRVLCEWGAGAAARSAGPFCSAAASDALETVLCGQQPRFLCCVGAIPPRNATECICACAICTQPSVSAKARRSCSSRNARSHGSGRCWPSSRCASKDSRVEATIYLSDTLQAAARPCIFQAAAEA